MIELSKRHYFGTGTIRENRLKNCPIEKTVEMKKMPRGSFSNAVDSENDVHVCRWTDNSIVTMISNCHGCQPITRVKRYSKKEKKVVEVECPHIVREYNMHMSSTDRYKQDTNRLRIGIHGKKWWWPLFTWLIDASVVNAWKLHQGNMSQIDFRREITTVYLRRHSVAAKGPGRQSSLQTQIRNELRYDRKDHFVVPTQKRRRCAGDLCQRRPFSACDKCDVGLCLFCFKEYHSS